MVEYTIIRTKRETVALTVNKKLEVVVRAPKKISKSFIEAFVEKNLEWIENQKKLILKREEDRKKNSLSEAEIEELKRLAKSILPQKVKYYSNIMSVKPTGVKITSAKTRWGSCNYKNSLCFSYRIMLLPEDIIDSIVVHELAHIRVKNHSQDFYNEIHKYMPDYKSRDKQLKILEKGLPY